MVNSKSKSNGMWKLDILEAKFTGSAPRFPHTKKLLEARNNNKLLKKLPNSKEEAIKEISALKSDFFDKKYYGSCKKLSKEVKKVIKSDLNKLEKDDTKRESVIDFCNEENINTLVVSKVIKCITSAVLVNKDSKMNPPLYISQEIRNILTDKTSLPNPSAFFIKFCQNDKVLNSYISALWNSKSIKQLLEEIEWAFKMVRGNLSSAELKARKKLTGKDADKSDSDIESESDEENNKSHKEDPEDYSKYSHLIADSEAENDEAETLLDPNINYDEVTDEEASDGDSLAKENEHKSDLSEDSFFADEEKPKKYNLPELAVGYYSDVSDEEEIFDVDNDQVVKEATTQRKNRRGQRARQKIWAKKFGKEAKHVKDEQAKLASEREIRRLEYEERCRRRELKALEKAPTGSNSAPLGERKPISNKTAEIQQPIQKENPDSSANEKVHPSWEAKKLAQEKLKNVKFTGKKITFD